MIYGRRMGQSRKHGHRWCLVIAGCLQDMSGEDQAVGSGCVVVVVGGKATRRRA